MSDIAKLQALIDTYRMQRQKAEQEEVAKPCQQERKLSEHEQAVLDNEFSQIYLRNCGEDFQEKYMRPKLARVSREEILSLVRDTCKFFGLDDSCDVYDVSQTSLTTHMRNSLNEAMAKDELYYNLDELIHRGVTTVNAFTLVLTHEFAHRYFKNKMFYGRNHGAWELELACDFFGGIRSGVDGIYTAGMRWSLGSTTGTRSHPPGYLRLQFIQYGYYIAFNCKFLQKKVTFKLYLEAYNRFLESQAKIIWEEQQKIMWDV